MKANKPLLNFFQIFKLNIGFLGIQYSFGLQQTAIGPVYKYLGVVDDSKIPILFLAGPITGLIIQPIIGSISDNTWHPKWGRRKPFFLIGAVFCSLSLFVFPFCSALWMAVGLLWILNAANNTAMEPYRAFIADHLDEKQQPSGFLAQSFFTGLGITLANFSLYLFQSLDSARVQSFGSIPRWVYGSFIIGAITSITSVWFSVRDVKEIPPSQEMLFEIKAYQFNLKNIFSEVFTTIQSMPRPMWLLSVVYFFQWYALFIYWQFNSLSIAGSIFGTQDPQSLAFSEAVGWSGILNGTYNAVTFIFAFGLLYLVRKMRAEWVHSTALLVGGISLAVLPSIATQSLAILPMIGLGIAWASIMGVPYIFIVKHLPEGKYGIYMGIINMMIVIPMLIQTITFGSIYKYLLESSPQNAIFSAGVMLSIAGILTALFFRSESSNSKVF